MRMGKGVEAKIVRDREELPPRQIEENFARRIEYEMDRRQWSQERVAREMNRAGCPIHQSAISKITRPRRGISRRSITLEEAVSFSRVFDLALDEMFDSILVARADEIRLLLLRVNILYTQMSDAWQETRDVAPRLAELMEDKETADGFFDWLNSLPEDDNRAFMNLLGTASGKHLDLVKEILETQTAQVNALKRLPGQPRAGWTSEIVLDLERLQQLPKDQAGPLARYVATVQSERGDHDNKAVKLGREDLRALAVLYDHSVPELTKELISWGVLDPESPGLVRDAAR